MLSTYHCYVMFMSVKCSLLHQMTHIALRASFGNYLLFLC